jgi:prepilin-type N-terminal cleavage/methylation domain-containing protein
MSTMANVENERGMTLTEILVAMIIMGVLASLLLPAVAEARRRARSLKCVAQLKGIGAAIKTYEVDFRDYPPWLSNLVPMYLGEGAAVSPRALICPNDYANPPGGEGRLSQTITGIDKCDELDDIEMAGAGSENVFTGKGRWTPEQEKTPPATVRNVVVQWCSYSYEFGIAACSIWKGGNYPDLLGNRDGVTSWREVKLHAERDGYIDAQGNRDPTKAYDGRVPIVRCYWHLPAGAQITFPCDPRLYVWNLRCGDMSVSRSDPSNDGWQKEQ